MERTEPFALDYFSGGVPTGEFFRGTLDDVRAIASAGAKAGNGIDRLQEICFVGALSYFEAFCKDLFASLINIEPRLIEHLKASGHDVTVDGTTVALYGSSISHRLGFLLAEKYDFGTAKSINALYGALLKIAPFAKDEAHTYAGLLRDRNLLTRHGGTYTMNYLAAGSTLDKTTTKDLAFWDSRVITQDDVIAAITFLESIARRTVRTAREGLSRYIQSSGITYNDERTKALKYIGWWGDDQSD